MPEEGEQAVELSHRIEIRTAGGLIELSESEARRLFHDLGELLRDEHRRPSSVSQG